MTLEEVREKAEKQEEIYAVHGGKAIPASIRLITISFNEDGSSRGSIVVYVNNFMISRHHLQFDLDEIYNTEEEAKTAFENKKRNYAIEEICKLMKENNLTIEEIMER